MICGPLLTPPLLLTFYALCMYLVVFKGALTQEAKLTQYEEYYSVCENIYNYIIILYTIYLHHILLLYMLEYFPLQN